MPTVHDVMVSKGSPRLLTISPAASVLDAVEKMNELKVGALIVMEDGEVLGIFSERDVLRHVIGDMQKAFNHGHQRSDDAGCRLRPNRTPIWMK